MSEKLRLTIAQAEEYTRLPRRVIKLAVNRGELRAFRPSGPKGHLYFEEADLAEWVAAADTFAQKAGA
ncbi:helix-turn-helix domain-containing protein [Pseudonocardia lutea]|uniref:Helix-turn-helix domain-containing protein n=1 Tax=Pseudonocardia lutea TaxID=2172015 RepID=A0ABW1I1I6_9PSEU